MILRTNTCGSGTLRGMGLEANARARIGRKSAEGKAHLDKDKLDFTSPAGLSFHVPFSEMEGVAAKGGELAFRWRGEAVSLALGAQADKWLAKIKTPRGRMDKLGVKAGAQVTVLGVADSDFAAELEERIGGAGVSTSPGDREQDAIFLAVGHQRDLAKLRPLQAFLKRAGAIWVVRPKGRDVVVTERQVMAAAKEAGLVDVKVVSFSDTHTAEKLVIPVKKR